MSRWVTADQHLDGQLAVVKAAGAETIYREKISGARADRPQLAKLMAGLKPGDMVLVTKLDRLGHSTRELLDLIERRRPAIRHHIVARSAALDPPGRTGRVRAGIDH